MNPSEYEIQREVEVLRDLRRRSTTPGGLSLDPDLPVQASPASPNFDQSQSSSSAPSEPADQTDDPFHLFWVPADVHPELAPAEFRAFIKEHATNPPSSELARSSSHSSTSGLGRKKSMLRNQYRPSENDGVEQEEVVPLRRNRTSTYGREGPQLTINDLQKLEELAEEASESHDATRLRSILRRSLSLNVSPTAIEQMEDVPEMDDEADAPIIVPPPGLILRRAARTKIRKPSLPGDGGGHRFGSRRGSGRAQTAGSPAPALERRLSDVSSSDHGDSSSSHEVFAAPIPRPRTLSHDAAMMQRPDSFSDVYDAYALDEDEDITSSTTSTAPVVEALQLYEEPASHAPPEEEAQSPVQSDLLEALGPALHQPQPQQPYLAPSSQKGPSRTPSPAEAPAPSQEPSYTPQPAPAATQEPGFTPHLPSSYLPPSTLASQAASSHRKEKDKKGLFGSKSNKKDSKHKEKEREGRSAEKSGFFGSLFGGKKKHEEHTPVSTNAGREAAQALLGVSKSSKSRAPSPAPPGSPLPGGGDNWSRFPIHVERAIYRLSHIKLANPRRPLYEQVLISNLMFWYLGVINNKTPTTPSAPSTPTQESHPTDGDADEAEREGLARERAEQEHAEQERQEREKEMKKKESGKRGPLTKPPPGGAPAGGRRHEMPVKGPSYEMQHRAMEQEYGGYQQSGPTGRAASAPPQQYQHRSQYSGGAPQLAAPQAQGSLQMPDHFYYSPDQQQQQQPQRSTLPPGAMAPIDTSGWMNQQPSNGSNKRSPPTSPNSHRSRSPPSPHSSYGHPHEMMANSGQLPGRAAGRSLSATAVPTGSPPSTNGKLRKGASAHAVPSGGGRRGSHPENGEEEDVPLAVWQQQRRR